MCVCIFTYTVTMHIKVNNAIVEEGREVKSKNKVQQQQQKTSQLKKFIRQNWF